MLVTLSKSNKAKKKKGSNVYRNYQILTTVSNFLV